MNILGIETSCDETAASVVKDGKFILSNVIASQIDLHSMYGGVVPELASRKHIEAILPVVRSALKIAKLTLDDIHGIAVTGKPGLIGSLLVGVEFAKGLAWAKNLPFVEIDHIEGHIYSCLLSHSDIRFPALALVVSGGHTDLILVKKRGVYQILGRTRDDAVGEAYDKVAKFMNLGYPGGPKIEKLAKEGKVIHKFPRAKMKNDSLDFSFSGLKTAVVNFLQENKKVNIKDLACSFQDAANQALIERVIEASKKTGVQRVLLCGGVSANMTLRKTLEDICGKHSIKVFYPSLELCTDNAAMIAAVGYDKFKK
ncbi:MAG: tRNA (adenosine(37)-N6)-threonylcarbamoyltransferase complex transferase subunit TsaD [Candidatus Firestonebacteria bacterium]